MSSVRMIAILVFALVSSIAAQGAPQPRGFSVVLVLGDKQGVTAVDDFPRGLRPALADIKDFLPYKTYRVLDTQLITGSNGGSARLSGLGEQVYEMMLEAAASPGAPKFTVKFKLQEAGAPASSDDALARAIRAADLEKKRIELERLISAWRKQRGPDNNEQVRTMEAHLEVLKRLIAIARAAKLIDARFDISPGETVVVGTSRLGAERGLIVLLTALSPRVGA